MIALGILLILLGLFIKVLFWIGVIVLIVGVALYIMPARRETRRWYW